MVLGVSAIWRLTAIISNIEVMASDAIPGISGSGEIRALFKDQQLAMPRHVTTVDEAQKRSYESKVGDLEIQIRQALKNFKELALSVREQELVSSIESLHGRVLQTWGNVLL